MAATPSTASAVDHLMIRSAAVIGHHRQAQTRRSRGMSVGFLVQSVLRVSSATRVPERSQCAGLVAHLAGLVDLDARAADSLVEAQCLGVPADHADVPPGRAGVRHGSAEAVDELAAVPVALK